MDNRGASGETEAVRHAWLLTLLAVLPVVPGLGNEIQDVDPAQYADVAARILRSGNWLELSQMTGPFQNKPPLMMWTQAILMSALGVDSLGARLPALLFGLVAVVATFLLGRELSGRLVGAIAAAFFGSSVAFHLMVADPKVDMPLTAFTALAVWAVLAARRRPAWLWLGWVSCGLAVLSKGPIGLVLPVLAVAPEVLRAGWAVPSRGLLGRVLGQKPLFGLAIVAAMVAPFYAAAARQAGSGAIGYHLWQQGLGRITGSSGWVNDTTPLFFTHTLLWALLPFSPLLLAALLRRAVGAWRERALPPRAGRVLVWWFVFGFVIISAAKYRLPQYVYWLGPPAAVLAAEELVALGARAARWWRVGFAALSVIAAAGGVSLLVACFPVPVEAVVAWGASLLGLPMAAWLLTRRAEEPWRVGAAAVASVAPFLLLFHGYVHPALLEFQPGREIGALVRQEDPTGAIVPYLDPLFPASSVGFYGQRDASMVSAEIVRELVSAGRSRLAVVEAGQEAALTAVGLRIEQAWTFKSYPTSVPRGRFLLARTREETLSRVVVVRLAAP